MPRSRARRRKGRPRHPIPGALPDDLYDYIHDPEPRRSPSPRITDIENLPVIDDWPEKVPITEAEIAVFERWFADVFDELFGPDEPQNDLLIISHYDRNKP